MSSHNTWEGVMNEIKQQVAKALQDDVARMVYNIIRKYMLDTIYSNTPTMYQRTFETLRALTVGKVYNDGNGICVEIYIDSDKIIPYKSEEGWNSHMSFDDTPYNKELPWLLEKGVQSGKPPYITPSFQYMHQSKTEIEDQNLHLKKIVGYMKSKGIDCDFK
jgi:hypothetical protein